ncbi:MAG: ABC transporter permease, partial [Bacillota bacterium]|nr:ABC transporter permease [Bacillota bacterium]
SFTEMERELATLKVIGFKSSKIRHIMLIQNIWLSTIGILIGIPCGRWILNVMVSTMGDTFDMMTILTLRNVLLSSIITLSLSVVVNLMFSKKIKNIDMVISLKSE